MPRQRWPYSHDVPVMQLIFELPDGSGEVTRMLEVDTGATGGDYAFSMGQSDCDALGTGADAPVAVADVSGGVTLRAVVWVIVNMPALNLRQRVPAICYPQAPGTHDGLVRLPFLTKYFDQWGAERDAAGNWQFCAERA